MLSSQGLTYQSKDRARKMYFQRIFLIYNHYNFASLQEKVGLVPKLLLPTELKQTLFEHEWR